ncbi:zinc-finger of a c2HC-type domain-containing protein [Phthorimaea operculella]|nr:zinc-finger of a c2HC-type domain-containing protein [Phthorimaea operculella]
MKKRTLSKLKSIFGSKKGKRQHQESSKCSRSPSPELRDSPDDDSFRPIARTPPPSRVGPPPSPPVPTQPIAPVPPQPSGPLPLSPCPVCNRTFLPPSLAKHVKICEKMAVKKRKTFDSSRQRREGLASANGVDSGTDLEQYLPKNFGLPENSPFLEKSPPATAKPAPKAKTPSVKQVIKGTKPLTDLQSCPHCCRKFGQRAFERHVEWCADKAKILPAASAPTPAHIATAKQRLNARTQYKAPLARTRRSSQSRDKSLSRSASVESNRAGSPPAPRECGDYKHTRSRASESVSSTASIEPEDLSPHVPVIRNSRHSTNSSGDANVKARQARLARDLSSSRNPQESPKVPQGTDLKTKSPNKPKNKITFKKQLQLKKLEEIARKYEERQKQLKEDKIKRDQERRQLAEEKRKLAEERAKLAEERRLAQEREKEINANRKNADKSQIPVLKKGKNKKHNRIYQELPDSIKEDFKEVNSPKPSTSKTIQRKNHPTAKNNKIDDEMVITVKSNKKEPKKSLKESTMSLDSLEGGPDRNKDPSSQSVGINTELLCPCVPCVIHDNVDPKPSSKKQTPEKNDKLSALNNEEITTNISEPKIELLFQNLTMVSSCDIQARSFAIEGSKASSSESTIEPLLTAQSNTGFVSDIIESGETVYRSCVTSNTDLALQETISENMKEVDIKKQESIRELSTEEYDGDYERDASGEFEDYLQNNYTNDNEDLIARHGSGDTYTKFTENPDDLEEFINMTDKMMSSHNFNEVMFDVENEVEALHTPKTNSLEAIYKTSDNDIKQDVPKVNFSDTLSDLKNDLQELLINAGDSIQEKINETENEDKRNVSDLEHITVYELKLYEQRNCDILEKSIEEKCSIDENTPETKLPSINENNKPKRKGSGSKKNVNRIYKSNRKFKMLGDQDRKEKDNKTFVKDQDSDNQSISAEAPPLKLPRIENKRVNDEYDPFALAARQMKELMSSDTNIPKSLQNSKNPNNTLPNIRPAKEKPSLSYLSTPNPKTMKDSLNKTFQKTPTLHRMKSFALIDDMSAHYDKIMSSLEQSINSKTSIRDDDSLCEDFDLEEFMTSFDEEIHKHTEKKRTCSSTTRVVKQSELVDSNKTSEINSISTTPKLVYSNGLIPVNKSNSLTFSSNNVLSENLFPSSMKRSNSLLDSIQKKTVQKAETTKTSRQKADQLEQDLMQSLKEFDTFYEPEIKSNQSNKETNYNLPNNNGTTKRGLRKTEKSKKSESITNGNYTPNGKSTDSAYSSLNRISPSKLSVCNSKESNVSNGNSPLEQIAGSDSSGCQKDDIRSGSSEEFLAMERSAELDKPIPNDVFTPSKDNPLLTEKQSSRVSSRRGSASWRPRADLSSSGSEASLHGRGSAASLHARGAATQPAQPPRLSRFCHECGSKFPFDSAKFCIECGVKRLLV